MNSLQKTHLLIGIVATVGLIITSSCQPMELPARPSTPTKQSVTPSPMLSSETDRATAEVAAIQTQLALIETITVSPPPTGRPPTRTPSPFVTGVFEVSYGPGIPQAYAMSTVWKGIVNGERTLIYAGVIKDTNQGVLVIQVYSTDLSNKLTTEYQVPGVTGVLTITSAIDSRLSLVTSRKIPIYFDVSSRQFLANLTDISVAPTVTFLPPLLVTATPPFVSTAYP